jgi:putative transposase
VPIVHYARNLLGMVSYANRKELAADLRRIFAATDRRSALKLASSVAEKWRQKGHEKVAEHVVEHMEDSLSCLGFPESHRRRIRTTNGLERLNQEIKRRSRVVRIFPNREACLRMVTALAVDFSEEWITGRRYLEMRELEEHRPERHREAEEVTPMEER